MKQMTVEQLKARMDAGEKVNLVDVREDYERTEFNIGGIHQKLGEIQAMQFDAIEDLKDEEVIIYCRSGNRSGIAGNILEMVGFKNVVNLSGGMLDWTSKYGQ